MMSTYSGWLQVRCSSVCRCASSSLMHAAICRSSSVESAFTSSMTSSLLQDIGSLKSSVDKTPPVKLPSGGAIKEGFGGAWAVACVIGGSGVVKVVNSAALTVDSVGNYVEERVVTLFEFPLNRPWQVGPYDLSRMLHPDRIVGEGEDW